jgi:hypothetical protein
MDFQWSFGFDIRLPDARQGRGANIKSASLVCGKRDDMVGNREAGRQSGRFNSEQID